MMHKLLNNPDRETTKKVDFFVFEEDLKKFDYLISKINRADKSIFVKLSRANIIKAHLSEIIGRIDDLLATCNYVLENYPSEKKSYQNNFIEDIFQKTGFIPNTKKSKISVVLDIEDYSKLKEQANELSNKLEHKIGISIFLLYFFSLILDNIKMIEEGNYDYLHRKLKPYSSTYLYYKFR